MKSWITATLALATFFCANLVLAAQDASVTFVTKPSTLIFNMKKDRISSIQLANLISTVMGFTVDQKYGYSGSYLTSPFNPPRVIVGVRTGVSANVDTFSGTEIPLKENLKWDELYTLLVERSEHRLNDVKTDYFSFGEDNSMQTPVSTVLDRLSKDVIENGSLTPLIYFADMSQTNLITAEINENMKKLEESVSALGGLMFLIKSDDISHHSRRVRQVVQSSSSTAAPPTPAPTPKSLNLAPDVDENFPIIFNILLFVGISLAITTLAICVAIATMDPGRDSLIYRVTSAQRFKKDN